MSTTDEIKSRIDIVSYVQRHVPSLKKAGRNHKACCPFHNEKTPSFVVNPLRQTWHCFGACAEGGDLFTFAQKLHGWDFKEALRELAAEAGVELQRQTPAQKSRSDHLEKLRGIASSAAEFFQDALRPESAAGIRSYLRDQRGLSDATVQAFQIGYAPQSWDFMLRALRDLGHNDDDIVEAGLALRNENGRVYDRFRNRLIIPIRDERGRVVGFGGRAMDAKDSAKYINSPQSAIFDKSGLLYGLDMGRSAIRDSGTVVIVEGYMDVIQAHQAGYVNVVAQMGTAMTEPQIRLVAPRYAKRIVLALDADEAGQTAARRSLEVARATLSRDYAGKLSVDIAILQIPAGKDPDDFLRESPEGWPALVDNAQNVADFVIDMEAAALRADSSLQARQTVAQAVLPMLLVSENNVYKQDNIQKLARRLRISERDMLAWAQEQAPLLRQPTPAPPQDEPPPDLPPEYWDNEHEMPPADGITEDESTENSAGSPATAKPLKRAIEEFCLSVLLKDPDLLYQVNRKLRELAAEDEDLLKGPLAELSADDFTQSQYRALMAFLQSSMAQDDMAPMEHLELALDDDLSAAVRALLISDPDAVSDRINGNFRVDLNDIFRRASQKARPGFSLKDELIVRALQLRLQRLDNERVEMQYLQEETQNGSERDEQFSEQIRSKIMLSMRAKARINVAVS